MQTLLGLKNSALNILCFQATHCQEGRYLCKITCAFKMLYNALKILYSLEKAMEEIYLWAWQWVRSSFPRRAQNVGCLSSAFMVVKVVQRNPAKGCMGAPCVPLCSLSWDCVSLEDGHLFGIIFPTQGKGGFGEFIYLEESLFSNPPSCRASLF